MAYFTSDTAQFRQFVPVSVNFTLDDVLPLLATTAGELLPRFLGDDTADELEQISAQDLSADTPENKVKSKALNLTRKVIASIGFAGYLPFGEVQIEDGGITISSREGRKAAFEYQTNRLEKTLLDAGWQALDELLKLIDTNRAIFLDWETSPYFEEYTEAVFKTPAEFSKYYPIQNRWLTFIALRPFLNKVELTWGENAQAKLSVLPSTVTDAQTKALDKKLRFALAYQTILEAIPNLSIEINGANVQVNYASQFGNALYYQPPGKDMLTWVMTNLQAQASLAWDSFNQAVTDLQPTSVSATGNGDPFHCGGFTLL